MSSEPRVRLGVNLDHVMTIRQARFTPYPDLKQAIEAAESHFVSRGDESGTQSYFF